MAYDRARSAIVLYGGAACSDFVPCPANADTFIGSATTDPFECARSRVHRLARSGEDVLRIRGDSFDDSACLTLVPRNHAFTVSLSRSSAGPTSARYVLWAWLGPPARSTTLRVRNIDLGCTVNATPLQPTLSPQPVACLEGGVASQACGSVRRGASPQRAPLSLDVAGFPRPIVLTLQGVVEDASATSTLGFSITNAWVVQVE
ncbi:MAG: hypothetical protein HYR85_00580 [Planctomycetes bacterium]|nr:hypothetical protein [Planctomycetota bacterium]MBI3847520.1 hypothetical protein [Planctomycetota bacterium]